MGLFSFFNKKQSHPPVKELIWKSVEAKFNGALDLIENYPDAYWFYWFPKTQSQFSSFIQSKGKSIDLKNAKTYMQIVSENSPAIFIEHYPLLSVEEELYSKWNNNAIFVLSSLDEPLFQQFGSERIIGIMDKLGMEDNERLEHSMISSAIKNAQEKIQNKVKLEFTAQSSEDWFQINLKKEDRY